MKDSLSAVCDSQPVNSFDVHLQPVPARGAVGALLAHKGLLPPVLCGLVHAQLRARQEALGALGTLGEYIHRTRSKKFHLRVIFISGKSPEYKMQCYALV